MVLRYPDLQGLIDLPAAPVQGESTDLSASSVIVDISPLQRQIRSYLARYDPYQGGYGWDEWGEWDVGGDVPAEIAPIVDLMQRYADAGQWANAQAVATALVEESLDVLNQFEDVNGEIANMVIVADAMLASALSAQATLPADQRLSHEQRNELLRMMYAIWHADVFDFGGIDLSQQGVEALIRDTTADERAMVESWLREEQSDGWSRRSVISFIANLRAAGGEMPVEDLLALYQDADLWDDVARLLLELGRVDEAIAMARKHLRVPHELTQFADALMRAGEAHATRAIGLVDDLLWEVEGKNAGHDQQLQSWLTDRYAAHGREQDALTLARRRFEHAPNFRTYQEVERIARMSGQPQGTWDEIRPELIQTLTSNGAWADLVLIHLAAGENMAALETFDSWEKKRQASAQLSPVWGAGWVGGELALKVAAAVERDAPDRAIEMYRRQADREIEARDRRNYQVATEHLARVKAILEREGRADEWTALIAALREEHKRLRALREELNNRNLR